MKNRPKLLITGAAGFTGQHASAYFTRNGYDVVEVVRSLPKNNISHSILPCDLVNNESVNDLVKHVKPDYVLHLAAKNHVGFSWSQPVLTVETNVLSTLYLAEAIRQVNPDCKMITVGSVLQYEPHKLDTLLHPYSLSKTLQILIAQAWESLFKVNMVIAKSTNLIGPGLSNGVCSILAKKIVEMERTAEQNVLEVSNLNSRRDFLDVRDAVRAYDYLFNLGKSGEEYVIASGVTLSLEDVIYFLRLRSKVEFTVEARSNDAGDVFKGNPDKLFKLGWSPQIAYEQSFADILDFYRQLG